MASENNTDEGSRIRHALQTLGKHPTYRHRMIELLLDYERTVDEERQSRENVAGPILDALHCGQEIYEKTLDDGTKFRFYYRSKIAREFLLAERGNPSHVWEPQTTKLVRFLCRVSEGNVVVGGAYFGDHSIIIAKSVRDHGKIVYCFEPNNDQFEMLVANISINQLDNVVAQRLALWHKSHEILTLDGHDALAQVVYGQTSEPRETNRERPELNAAHCFKTLSIDDHVLMSSSRIGLIILDVEGSELKVLQGTAETLRHHRLFVVFEIHRNFVDWTPGLQNTDIVQYLTSKEYVLFAIRDYHANKETGCQPVELLPIDRMYLAGAPHGFNVLAIPTDKVDVLQNDLFAIVEGLSPKLLRDRKHPLFQPAGTLPPRGHSL